MVDDKIPKYKDVNSLREKNYSDSKIIDDLKYQGMSLTDTYDTMRLADLAKNSEGMIMAENNTNSELGSGSFPKIDASLNDEPAVPNPPGMDVAPNIAPPMPSAQQQSNEMPPMPSPSGTVFPKPATFNPESISHPVSQAPSYPLNREFGTQQTSSGNMGVNIEEIEEVVESIIEERWKEVSDNIKKVITWKHLMEERFGRMDQDIKNIKENFNELYKAVVGKVGDYDQNLMKVGAELKAMERVFSQVLPTFTENVNDLSRVAEDIKSYAIRDKLKSKKKKSDD